MADDNKPLKYMRYAIGEIVLVVIGILIALQINNWNEERKMSIREMSYLDNLLSDMKADSIMLDEIITDQKKYLERTQKLISLVNNYYPENIKKFDSIYKYQIQGNPTFFPNAGTYQSLILGGNLDVISLNILKGSLTNLYEHYYQRLKYNGTIFDQKILNFNQPRKILINYGFTEASLKDPDLLNGLLDEMEWRQAYIKRCEATTVELLYVLELISFQTKK